MRAALRTRATPASRTRQQAIPVSWLPCRIKTNPAVRFRRRPREVQRNPRPRVTLQALARRPDPGDIIPKVGNQRPDVARRTRIRTAARPVVGAHSECVARYRGAIRRWIRAGTYRERDTCGRSLDCLLRCGSGTRWLRFDFVRIDCAASGGSGPTQRH